jgi:hypothetical protein
MSKPRHSGRLEALTAKPGRGTTGTAWRELRLAKCWPPMPVKTSRAETKKSNPLVRPK